MIRRGEPVPLGELGERRWALSYTITIVQGEDEDDGTDYSISALLTGDSAGSND